MKLFKVTVKGICPLLQSRHPTPKEEEKITQITGKDGKTRKLTDKEQFEIHAYKTKSGKFYQPSEMFEAVMVKAAVNFPMKGKKSYKDVIKGGVFVTPKEIIHKKQKFVMDSCWGVNPNTRGAIWVVRPRIDNWELDFQIELLTDEIVGIEILRKILDYAGLYVGIGAWRPKYGRFKVIQFKLMK